ncbi:MAG: Gfo/Idh/MocA family oxidoreductase [Planctomycetota bacterium]
MTRSLPGLNILVVGGGMISREVILPTLFQERRRGTVAQVAVAARTGKTIRSLRRAFPKEPLIGFPSGRETDPKAYEKAIARLAPPACVIVATPDDLHTDVVLCAIRHGIDCIVEKPLCLRAREARAIARAASRKGVYVLTDYHKRHDRAVRLLKRRVRQGELGEILHGYAWIEEKKEMPLKNFARWCERSSSFEYIGVHYVDVFHYVTGLLPKRLCAFGQKKFLPSAGKNAYDAIEALIEWRNGSALWVETAWVCSDAQSALTSQGMHLHGTLGEYRADHKDRNLSIVSDARGFQHVNPNFFQGYDSFDDGTEYVGYGYDSILQGLNDVRRIASETADLPPAKALARRKALLARWATSRALPEQALIGTAVIEGVRLSLSKGGRFVAFDERWNPRLE